MRKLLRAAVAWILKIETRLYLARVQPTIVAVAGVSNKSAVKRAIVDELRARGRVDVAASPKSYNTDIGLPLAVLQVEPSSFSFVGWTDVVIRGVTRICKPVRSRGILVLEYGVSEPNDMRTLLRIAKPYICVITDIIDHPQSRVSAETLAREMELLVCVTPISIVNTDSEYAAPLIARARDAQQTVITYGIAHDARYRATNVRETSNGQEFEVTGKHYELDKFGLHHCYATLAAFAVADALHE